MPSLRVRKVGIVACSGEELSEGTVTRLAALRVLHELRPDDTVTICLPLFLAGGDGERTFAKVYPTITVDGCDLRCAARGTEMYSAKPAASIVVSELLAELHLEKPTGRRVLNDAGKVAVDATARRVTELVDDLLGRSTRLEHAACDDLRNRERRPVATCSCGSGVPVMNVEVEGNTVEVVALPLIFEQLHGAGRLADADVGDDLLSAVKVYNFVAPESADEYRAALLREYAAFCAREAKA